MSPAAERDARDVSQAAQATAAKVQESGCAPRHSTLDARDSRTPQLRRTRHSRERHLHPRGAHVRHRPIRSTEFGPYLRPRTIRSLSTRSTGPSRHSHSASPTLVKNSCHSGRSCTSSSCSSCLGTCRPGTSRSRPLRRRPAGPRIRLASTIPGAARARMRLRLNRRTVGRHCL